MNENIVLQKAIDITPYNYGVWCSIGDGEPFVNEVVHRKWSDDGSKIWFMLESHNFISARPDDMIEVVKLERSPYQSEDLWERMWECDRDRMSVKSEAFEVSEVY